MRHLLSILSLFISLIANSQLKDTIFLKRVVRDSPYHFYNAIYIDTINNLNRSKHLSDFSFNNFDSTTYFSELSRLQPLSKIKYSLKDFPKQWVMLQKYKGQYYTYVPSELGEMYRFEITDSTTIDYTMEGPEPSRIDNITRLTPFQIIIYNTNQWEAKTLKINIIDTSNGVAIFTFFPSKKNTHGNKQLMVSVHKINKFLIVLNDCEQEKVPEFDFDFIDFTKLERSNDLESMYLD